MRFEVMVAIRYLRSRQKEAFISFIGLMSVFGIAIGVATLIVVLAVMSGFHSQMEEKMLTLLPHLVILHPEGFNDPEEVIREIKKVDSVTGISSYLMSQAIIKRGEEHFTGVFVEGIDPESYPEISDLSEYITQGGPEFGEFSLGKERISGMVIGKDLAYELGAEPGDELTLISPRGGKTYRFLLTAIFDTGEYENDSTLAFISLARAKEVFISPANNIGLRIENLFQAERIKSLLQQRLGYSYQVRTWMDFHKSLFSALKLEKRVMFLILTFIIIVACFNIISTLIMMVMKKTRDIGILRSLGATRANIMAIFVLIGIMVGILGTLLGTLGGLAITEHFEAISEFIKNISGFELFPKDIYFLDKIPIEVNFPDVTIVILTSLALSFLVTLFPAWRASRLDVVEALRYE